MNQPDESLINRIRERLADEGLTEEKSMFGSVCFMVNDKMCICVGKEEVLCRVGEEQAATEAAAGTAREMMHNGRRMKNFVFVDNDEVRTTKALEYWIKLSLQFNGTAKAAKKKKA